MQVSILVELSADGLFDAARQLTYLAEIMDTPIQYTCTSPDGEVTKHETKMEATEREDAESANPIRELAIMKGAATGPTVGVVEFEPGQLVSPQPTPVIVVDRMTDAAEVFAPPSAAVELDSEGKPWTEGVHSDNKAKTAKGAWRKRRQVGGAKKAPPDLGGERPTGHAIKGATIKEFQTAMAAVVKHDFELLGVLEESVNAATGQKSAGVEFVLKNDDPKITGKALALTQGIKL